MLVQRLRSGTSLPTLEGEEQENEKIFPGQGLFTAIRIKGRGLMGKMHP